MILGLQSLLRDEKKLLYKVDRNNSVNDYYYISNNKLFNSRKKLFELSKNQPNFKYNPKIVIKVTKKTASAGEITALCFKNMPNVEIYGRSCGFLSCVKWGKIGEINYAFTNVVCADSKKTVTAVISANKN